MSTQTATIMGFVLAIIVIVGLYFFFHKAPKSCGTYMGSNYVGGGNMEEQLAFAAGNKPYLKSY